MKFCAFLNPTISFFISESVNVAVCLFAHAAVPRGVEDHEQVRNLLRVHPIS